MRIDKKRLKSATFDRILGQERVKASVRSALLSGRNVILVGPPGVGKTTLAREVARLVPDETFVRVQGSPDLTAEDLLGDIDPMKALEFGPLDERAFTPGKIFKADKGVLFFDEINRCSEKLQNALLQALEEHTVTIGGYDVDFQADFIFIGTMNPDDTSTEELSDVFLDRFDLITVGYPETGEVELRIVRQQKLSLGAELPPGLEEHVVSFIRQLRLNPDVLKRPSVRASIGVVDRANAHAALAGRDRTTVEDIAAVLASVLAHRMSLKPSIKYLEEPDEFLRKQFESYARDHDLEGGDP